VRFEATAVLEALGAHLETTRGPRVRVGSVEGVSGVLAERLGHASGDE
jgi:hypothetical protein